MLLILRMLIAALFLALTYVATLYTSEAWDVGQQATAVTSLLNEGNQVLSACLLYSLDSGELWPADASVLTPQYLVSLPLPPGSAYATGLTATVLDWTVSSTNVGVVLLPEKLNFASCLAINHKQGLEGVPLNDVPSMLVTCYGNAEPYSLALKAQLSGSLDLQTPSADNPVRCADGSVTTSVACVAGTGLDVTAGSLLKAAAPATSTAS